MSRVPTYLLLLVATATVGGSQEACLSEDDADCHVNLLQHDALLRVDGLAKSSDVESERTRANIGTERDLHKSPREHVLKKGNLSASKRKSLGDTLVVFEGEGNDDEIWGPDAPIQRTMWRPSWAKSYRCQHDSCEECSGVTDCFSMDSSTGHITGNYTGATGTWKRMGVNILVTCPTTRIELIVIVTELQDAVLKSMWNGVELNNQHPLVRGTEGEVSPITSSTHVTTVKVNLIPDKSGGNEWTLEFIPDGVNAFIKLDRYSIIVGGEFAECEDTKTCLSTFADFGEAGLALRESNLLQLKCMQGLAIPNEMEEACDAWKDCMTTGGNGTINELMLLMDAAGVNTGSGTGAFNSSDAAESSGAGDSSDSADGSGRADGTADSSGAGDSSDRGDGSGRAGGTGRGNGTGKGARLMEVGQGELSSRMGPPLGSCLDPPTADIESWDCSCADDALQVCVQIAATTVEYSETTCLRTHFCNHPMICEDWYNEFCTTDAVKQHNDSLQALFSALDTSNEGRLQERKARPHQQGLRMQEAEEAEAEALDSVLSSKCDQ